MIRGIRHSVRRATGRYEILLGCAQKEAINIYTDRRNPRRSLVRHVYTAGIKNYFYVPCPQAPENGSLKHPRGIRRGARDYCGMRLTKGKTTVDWVFDLWSSDK